MKHFSNYVRRLTGQQENIYMLFVVGMMVPNIALCITESFPFFTALCSLLMPLGFYMLWGIAARRPGGMIFGAFPLMILGAFQLVIMYLFGGSIIAVDMFTNLFTTNASEAGELLGNIWPAVVGVCVLYIPLLFLAGRSLAIKERLSAPFRRRMAIWGVSLLILGGVTGGLAKMADPSFGIKYHVFPASVIYNIKLTLDKWKLRNAYYETSRDFTFHTVKTRKAQGREIYVLIVGETARAANWSIFGYDRETSPRLQARDGVVAFSRLTTECNTTHKSVPLMLASVSAANFKEIYEQKSIITAFKEAGFRTVFVSNQVPNRSLIDFFAAEADERIDIGTQENELISENCYDGEMIPLLQEIIAKSSDNLLLVLHTRGSHFEYNKRYPDSMAQFTPHVPKSISSRYRRELVNSYDNSIYYTDYVIDGIIAALDTTKACAALLYCSDHGEDLLDDKRKRFLHASPTPTYYQLHTGALAWFSQNYREAFPNPYVNAMRNREKTSTSANIFHTMANIAFLSGDKIDLTYSLVSDEFIEIPRIYLDDHDNMCTMEDCGLKKQDFEMMRAHHLIK